MHAADLPAGWRGCLATIVAGAWACTRAEALDRAAVAELEGAGLVARWASPAGALVTLTPRGEALMGVEIDEKAEGVPSWEDRPARMTRSVRLPGSPGERRLARPDLVRAAESAAPDPAAEAKVRECAELIRRFEADPSAPGAWSLIERAESIVAGCQAELAKLYLFDGDRPRLLWGRLVPRDGRMGPGRAG